MQKAKAYAVEGLEEGGDDPKTATDVVHALYAKYKKNVSARRRHASRHPRTQTTRTPPTSRKNPKRKESAMASTPLGQNFEIFPSRSTLASRLCPPFAVPFRPALTHEPHRIPT
jgi:hypothetical protein